MNNHTIKRRRKVTYPLIGAAVLTTAIGFAVSVSALNGSAGGPSVPESFVGEWDQTNTEIFNGMEMEAQITAGAIQINAESRDGDSSIYWLGTFPGDKSTAKSFKTTSIGDSDAMERSLLGSQDKTKTFEYKDGRITFEFTIMGNTKTVILEKEAEDSAVKPKPAVKTTKPSAAKTPATVTTKPAKVPTVKAPAPAAPKTVTKPANK
ncbi:lipoprotein [Streptomyces phage Miek]|nr:lipoprotein [Streptomyces phage Miek]